MFKRAGVYSNDPLPIIKYAGNCIFPAISLRKEPFRKLQIPPYDGRMEINMDKDKQEKLNQKKSNEVFNSITEKVKPENQNQTHNSRREGMGPNTKRKPE